MAIGAPRAIDILLIIIHENLESCRLDKNKKKESARCHSKPNPSLPRDVSDSHHSNRKFSRWLLVWSTCQEAILRYFGLPLPLL